MDVHVPIAVTDSLRRRGIDVLSAQEDGTSRASDVQLLIRTVELNRLIVTQDEDFLMIAADWQAQGKPFPGILFARQNALSIGEFVEDLVLICQIASEAELRDFVTFLPLPS